MSIGHEGIGGLGMPGQYTGPVGGIDEQPGPPTVVGRMRGQAERARQQPVTRRTANRAAEPTRPVKQPVFRIAEQTNNSRPDASAVMNTRDVNDQVRIFQVDVAGETSPAHPPTTIADIKPTETNESPGQNIRFVVKQEIDVDDGLINTALHSIALPYDRYVGNPTKIKVVFTDKIYDRQGDPTDKPCQFSVDDRTVTFAMETLQDNVQGGDIKTQLQLLGAHESTHIVQVDIGDIPLDHEEIDNMPDGRKNNRHEREAHREAMHVLKYLNGDAFDDKLFELDGYTYTIPEVSKYAPKEDFDPKIEAALAQLRVTPQDIDERQVLAVGYARSELLPPYDSNLHLQRADRILDYLETTQATILDDYPEDIDPNELFPENKVVEVVGGLAGICVADAVESITQTGMYAYVDSRKILSKHPPDLSSDQLRDMLSEMLNEYGIKRLELDEYRSLFYTDGATNSSSSGRVFQVAPGGDILPIDPTAPKPSPLADQPPAANESIAEEKEGNELQRIIDRHPDWPPILAKIFYSTHETAEDFAGLQDQIGDADIYLYENVTGNFDVPFLQALADMDSSKYPPDFLDGYIEQHDLGLKKESIKPETEKKLRIKGSKRESEIHALFGSGAKIGHMDLREGENNLLLQLDSYFSQQVTGTNFDTRSQVLRNNLFSIAELQNQRQDIKVKRFEEELERIFAEHDELKDIQDRPLVVLITRGTGHSGSLEKKLSAQGLQTEALFPEVSGDKLSPSSECIKQLMQGKEPTADDLAKAQLDLELKSIIAKNFNGSITNYNIFGLYLHRVASYYSTKEIKEFYAMLVQNDVPEGILVDGLLASKGLGRIPTSYGELKLYTDQISEKE